MTNREAMKIIIDELNKHCTDQLRDRRTKLYKAVIQLDDYLKYDQAFLEGLIDETIEEFESEENDYAEN